MASEIWQHRSSIVSPVVDEERMRPGHWLVFLQCFDADGWVAGRISGP